MIALDNKMDAINTAIENLQVSVLDLNGLGALG
jgi:hypothetical protein